MRDGKSGKLGAEGVEKKCERCDLSGGYPGLAPGSGSDENVRGKLELSLLSLSTPTGSECNSKFVFLLIWDSEHEYGSRVPILGPMLRLVAHMCTGNTGTDCVEKPGVEVGSGPRLVKGGLLSSS